MVTENRNPRSAGIDRQDTLGVLAIINEEDAGVAPAVGRQLSEIARAVDMAVETLREGGRIFYVGAGTSGRLGTIDASECPPTFNSPARWFQAIVAGGPDAVSDAREHAEDEGDKAADDLEKAGLDRTDLVVGIAASGRTPYTLAAIESATEVGARTVAIVCAPDTPIAAAADVAIVVEVGPEVIAGSTRMKAGTAQKLVLNMLSTATMVRMGMTYDHWMINVQMSNDKLRERGVGILRQILNVDRDAALRLVERSGGELKTAVLIGRLGCGREEAERLLEEAGGNLRAALGEL